MKPDLATHQRIDLLDSFRALSILSVILFHFFSRWTPPYDKINLYPYGGDYNYFIYGYLGVRFFFIISGFVIFYTLTNTLSLVEFWKKRIIRLYPSMIMASLIIFFFFRCFDRENLFESSHIFKNFIPSITFLSPKLLKKLSINVNYLNGSFWSLWPEIQFYLFASLIFFINRRKFILHISSISIGLILINNFMQERWPLPNGWINQDSGFFIFFSTWISGCFNLIDFLPYFLLGIYFFHLFQAKGKGEILDWKTLGALIITAILLLDYNRDSTILCLIILLQLLLFFLFVYQPFSLFFINYIWIHQVGRSSYFLYLIHENIGIFLITVFAVPAYPYGAVFPLVLIVLLIIFSVWFTRTIDVPMSRWLKKRWL